MLSLLLSIGLTCLGVSAARSTVGETAVKTLCAGQHEMIKCTGAAYIRIEELRCWDGGYHCGLYGHRNCERKRKGSCEMKPAFRSRFEQSCNNRPACVVAVPCNKKGDRMTTIWKGCITRGFIQRCTVKYHCAARRVLPVPWTLYHIITRTTAGTGTTKDYVQVSTPTPTARTTTTATRKTVQTSSITTASTSSTSTATERIARPEIIPQKVRTGEMTSEGPEEKSPKFDLLTAGVSAGVGVPIGVLIAIILAVVMEKKRHRKIDYPPQVYHVPSDESIVYDEIDVTRPSFWRTNGGATGCTAQAGVTSQTGHQGNESEERYVSPSAIRKFATQKDFGAHVEDLSEDTYLEPVPCRSSRIELL